MVNKPRMKMPISERAKQFMPFSALKGLEEALREKERIIVEKSELSEESSSDIAAILNLIDKGSYVKVVYFYGGEYILAEGIVTAFDKVFRKMSVVKTEVKFEDIYKLSVCNQNNTTEYTENKRIGG